MHEYSLAQAVLNSVEDFVKKDKARGKLKVVVSIGELQHVSAQQFREILEGAAMEKGLKAEFSVETESAAFKCFSCGNEWVREKAKKKLKNHDYDHLHDHKHDLVALLPELACPKCRSNDIEITAGLEVKIKEIVLDKGKSQKGV
ncbi:MAG: hydrogenase/urease maturation nickel metallochaperone HypA [Candidatus Diapherotrites archaeon]